MTIIEPKKKKSKFIIFAPILALLAAGVYLNVSFYNSIVELRHEIVKQEKEWERLEVEGADLKNKVYGLFDAAVMKKTASELGLILDKNPSYLELSADELARNL